MNNLRCNRRVKVELISITAEQLNVKQSLSGNISHSTAPQLCLFFATLTLIASGVIHIQSLRDFKLL